MDKWVLLVDDNVELLKTAAELLQAAGYSVLTAKDATDAMQKTEGVFLGAIVLDLDLAGEDGMMLFKFLKRNQPGVPIILYTGLEHDEEAIAKFLERGAAQYLKKGSSDLVQAVKRSFR